jgi:hypothetical protein
LSEASDTVLDIRPGQLIDRHVVEEVIGEGGRSTVNRVTPLHLKSSHAQTVVTILRPAIRRRVLDEGRCQALLNHPNVLTVTDAILYKGLPWRWALECELTDSLTHHRLGSPHGIAVGLGIVDAVDAGQSSPL